MFSLRPATVLLLEKSFSLLMPKEFSSAFTALQVYFNQKNPQEHLSAGLNFLHAVTNFIS